MEKVQSQINNDSIATIIYDSLPEAAYHEGKTYIYLQTRTGLLTGIQFIGGDSVNIAIGLPFENGLRIFPKGSQRVFYDIEMGVTLFVLNKHILTPCIGAKIGFGVLSNKNSSGFLFQVGYLAGGNDKERPELEKYRDMLVLRYAFEESSFPISFDLAIPLKNTHGVSLKSSIALIGIKLPIFNDELSKKRTKKRR